MWPTRLRTAVYNGRCAADFLAAHLTSCQDASPCGASTAVHVATMSGAVINQLLTGSASTAATGSGQKATDPTP